MFTCLQLPTIVIRVLVDAVILLVSLIVVLPRHRTAGLTVSAGALLNIIVGLGIPALEVVAVTAMGQMNNPSGAPPSGGALLLVVAMMVVPMIGPLAQAVNGLCYLAGMLMLAGKVPRAEREDWNQ